MRKGLSPETVFFSRETCRITNCGISFVVISIFTTLTFGDRRVQRHFSPFRSFVDEQDEVANLLDFERGAGNARFGQKVVRVEEAGEFEATAGGVEAARFVGKLLLLVDPCAVERGLQLRDAGLAQRRADVGAQNVTKVVEFQDAGGRMLERRRDHAVMMVSQPGRGRDAAGWAARLKRRKIA